MKNLDDGLRELITRGFGFQYLRDRRGEIASIIGSYGWPEFYDKIYIFDEFDAQAARVELGSRRGAEQIVWSYEGDAVCAVFALLDLPSPYDPGVLRLPKRRPTRLWLPSDVHGTVTTRCW